MLSVCVCMCVYVCPTSLCPLSWKRGGQLPPKSKQSHLPSACFRFSDPPLKCQSAELRPGRPVRLAGWADRVEERQGSPVIFYSHSPAVCLCLGSASGAVWSQKASLVRSLFIPNLRLIRLGFGNSKRRDEVSEGWGGKKKSWWKGDGRDGLMLWLESSKRGVKFCRE